MKQVFDGLIYDTDDAIEIAMNESRVGIDDFGGFEEAIYKPDSGRWFLWGKGGPHTRWREPVGNNAFGSGEAIHALSEVEALDWFERTGADPDVIAAHFTIAKA